VAEQEISCANTLSKVMGFVSCLGCTQGSIPCVTSTFFVDIRVYLGFISGTEKNMSYE